MRMKLYLGIYLISYVPCWPSADRAGRHSRIALLRVERVGQLGEPRPQTFVFVLAAFTIGRFIAAPFVLFSLILIRLLATPRHPSYSPARLFRRVLFYLAKTLKSNSYGGKKVPASNLLQQHGLVRHCRS